MGAWQIIKAVNREHNSEQATRQLEFVGVHWRSLITNSANNMCPVSAPCPRTFHALDHGWVKTENLRK
jgi:hypothetical protein